MFFNMYSEHSEDYKPAERSNEHIRDSEPPEATSQASGQPGAIEWMNPRDLEADGTPRDYRDPQEKRIARDDPNADYLDNIEH
jgi:hypothetical protein